MKNVTFLAADELVLRTESGEVVYPKGAIIHLEQDEEGGVFISYHEADDEKVHAFEIDITSRKILEAIFENVILEEDVEDEITYVEMTLDQLILDEGLTNNEVSCYITEVTRKRKLVFQKGKKKAIMVPTRRFNNKRTAKQKAALKSAQRMAKRSPGAKRQRAISMKKRRSAGLSEAFLATDYMFNESLQAIVSDTAKKLESVLGDRAKVSVSEDHEIKVRLLQAEEAEVLEAIEQADVHYTIEGDENNKVIKLVKPMAEAAVTSLYDVVEEESDDDSSDDVSEADKKAKKDADMDDEDDDDNDKDDDEEDKDDLKGSKK